VRKLQVYFVARFLSCGATGGLGLRIMIRSVIIDHRAIPLAPNAALFFVHRLRQSGPHMSDILTASASQ